MERILNNPFNISDDVYICGSLTNYKNVPIQETIYLKNGINTFYYIVNGIKTYVDNKLFLIDEFGNKYHYILMYEHFYERLWLKQSKK